MITPRIIGVRLNICALDSKSCGREKNKYMTSSKESKVVQSTAEPFLTKERQFSVTTIVMARSLAEAISKAPFCEPVSVTLIDIPEDNGTVGFYPNDGGK